MESHINKFMYSLIAVLLTIIGFFLCATYTKINETNERVHSLQVQLAEMNEKEKHFITHAECVELIDKKLARYHGNSN